MGNTGYVEFEATVCKYNFRNDDFFNEVVLARLILVLCLSKGGGAEICQYALKMNALVML